MNKEAARTFSHSSSNMHIEWTARVTKGKEMYVVWNEWV